jgi:hypothetical protein
MDRPVFRLAFLLMIGVLLLVAVAGCPPGDDDDDDNDDAADDDSPPSDDDTQPTDDDVSPGDDDDNDDDNDNDTAGPPPPEEALIVIGLDAVGLNSWVKTKDGWAAFSMPPFGDEDQWGLGPTLAVDGERVTAVYNTAWSRDMPGTYYGGTSGQHWISFTLPEGWRSDPAHPVTGEDHIVTWLAQPEGGPLRAFGHWSWLYTTHGWPSGFDLYSGRLGGLEPGAPAFNVQGPLPEPIAIAAAGSGAVYLFAAENLLRLDGQTWSVVTLPGTLANRNFRTLLMLDEENGVGTWSSRDTGSYFGIAELREGVWTSLEFPRECRLPYRFHEGRIEGNAQNVLITGGDDYRFLQRRGGQWLCREFEENGLNSLTVEDVLVLPDGRAFFAATDQITVNTAQLLEITDDAVIERELPVTVERILSIHALGDWAPAESGDASRTY